MTTIETTFSYDEGMVKNCKPNGVIKTERHTINIDYIISISPWNGDLLHKGRVGTKITDVNYNTYIDDRPYEQFILDAKKASK